MKSSGEVKKMHGMKGANIYWESGGRGTEIRRIHERKFKLKLCVIVQAKSYSGLHPV